MPKALAVNSVVVRGEDVAEYEDRIYRRRQHFRHAGCRYWVFRAEYPPGAFLEFMEADDRESLRSALADVPDAFEFEPPLYHEMEPA